MWRELFTRAAFFSALCHRQTNVCLTFLVVLFNRLFFYVLWSFVAFAGEDVAEQLALCQIDLPPLDQFEQGEESDDQLAFRARHLEKLAHIDLQAFLEQGVICVSFSATVTSSRAISISILASARFRMSRKTRRMSKTVAETSGLLLSVSSGP